MPAGAREAEDEDYITAALLPRNLDFTQILISHRISPKPENLGASRNAPPASIKHRHATRTKKVGPLVLFRGTSVSERCVECTLLGEGSGDPLEFSLASPVLLSSSVRSPAAALAGLFFLAWLDFFSRGEIPFCSRCRDSRFPLLCPTLVAYCASLPSPNTAALVRFRKLVCASEFPLAA